MSASRQKRMRKDESFVPGQAPEKKSNLWKWIVGVAVVLIAAALVCVGLKFDNDYFADRNIALTVSNKENPELNHEVTAAEYNYFYRSVYLNIANNYGNDANTLSYLASYITEQTDKQICNTYAVYDAALADGKGMTEELQKKIDEDVEQLRDAAKNFGYKDLDALLSDPTSVFGFGPGCNEENYRKFREVQEIASQYTEEDQEKFSSELTQQKFNEYYANNRLNFDTVNFRWFLVPVAENRDMDATEAAAKTMETMIYNDIPGFTKMAHELANEEEQEYYAEESATLVKGEKINYVDSELKDWMADETRVEGDTLVVRSQDEIGTYVACFLSRDNHDYPTVNVRHILVTAAADADEETKKAAKEKADGYLKEYLDGDKTEDSFGEIAKSHSEDGGSASNGGLYESVTPGQMVESFNDWCFDPARQPGDTGIVETEYGYHVMYFVGQGPENACWKMVTDEMKKNHNTAWLMRLTENYETEENEDGLSYTARLQPNAQ